MKASHRKSVFVPLVAAGLTLALAGTAQAESYLESDEYKDGEEKVNVFFKEAEYAILVDDFERNGKSFDWGWALTPGWQAASVSTDQKGRRKGPKLEKKPKQFAFDLASYKSIVILDVENFSGLLKPDVLKSVQESFAAAFNELGLEVKTGKAAGDLELKIVIVDYNTEGGGFGLIQIKPFIELEVRLRESSSGKDLLLIRNQEHGNSPEDGAFGFASDLVAFLR